MVSVCGYCRTYWVIKSHTSFTENCIVKNLLANSDNHSCYLYYFMYSKNICYLIGGKKKKVWNHNHRMVWVGRNFWDHLVPTLLVWARTLPSRSGCSKLKVRLASNVSKEGNFNECFSWGTVQKNESKRHSILHSIKQGYMSPKL